MEASLTGLYPYAGVALTDWLTAWATSGYGLGAVTVKEQSLTAGLDAGDGRGKGCGVRLCVRRRTAVVCPWP